jgi:ribosomal protein L37AE/L43A
MTVKCGVNSENREDALIFVCHHCGMPVCEEHGWVIPADDAFDDSHKPDDSHKRISRAAMHCRDCAEQYHKSATKRHGWAGSGLTQAAARAEYGPVRPGERAQARVMNRS